jgi:hypothetical protein
MVASPVRSGGRIYPTSAPPRRTDEIRLWGKLFPDAHNTGVLTRITPCFDIDILNPGAAEAVEGLIRERVEERGPVLVRIGKAPKRAVLLRTDEPFKGRKGRWHFSPNAVPGEEGAGRCRRQGFRREVAMGAIAIEIVKMIRAGRCDGAVPALHRHGQAVLIETPARLLGAPLRWS